MPEIRGAVLMPRRITTVEREIPLYIVPHMIMNRIRIHGEAMERVIVRKTRRHFYNISIQTKPVKRELRPRTYDITDTIPLTHLDQEEREQE
jgi:hypothetical protein